MKDFFLKYMTIKNGLILILALAVGVLGYENWTHAHTVAVQYQSLAATVDPVIPASIPPSIIPPPEAPSVVTRPGIKLDRFSSCELIQQVRDIYGFTEMVGYNIKNGWSLANFITKLRSCGLF